MSITTETQRKEFAERGFVALRGLLQAEEIARFGAAVDRAVAARTAHDTRTLAERTHYEQSFHQCINLWEDFADVRPLTFHPRLGQVASELLDRPVLRVWHDQALYKEPGGRGTDAHHDQPYWPLNEPNTVTAWISFNGARRESGCMGYVPGSHHFGVKRFSNIFTGTGFDLEHGEEARGVPPEFVPVEPGDVVFHHGLTIHVAGPNSTPDMRRVHTVIYFADGSTRKDSKQLHPSVDRAGIAPGAVVDSAVTPIAFPRAPGDLPEPPPLPEPRLRGWPGWGRRA
ncbi:MAG TPA: phytanoyl-CoA dioxygenase family protein [Myxococcota bacterium]|nr:phytanoyl-CoA dioxygenase family protein [Myxococcota bacterium]